MHMLLTFRRSAMSLIHYRTQALESIIAVDIFICAFGVLSTKRLSLPMSKSRQNASLASELLKIFTKNNQNQ